MRSFDGGFVKIVLVFLLLAGVVGADENLVTKKATSQALNASKKLSLAEDETIMYTNKYNFGNLQCNVGSIFSEEELKAVGFVEVPSLDIYARIKLPDVDMFQNRITHCAVSDGKIYILEQVDTQRATSMRQTFLYVCRVDKKKQKCIDVPIDFYSSYVGKDKNNFLIKNGVIEIRGKSRPKDVYDNQADKDFKVLMKIF